MRSVAGMSKKAILHFKQCMFVSVHPRHTMTGEIIVVVSEPLQRSPTERLIKLSTASNQLRSASGGDKTRQKYFCEFE